MEAKQYTGRNVRKDFKDRRVATVPENILQRVLSEYTDAVESCQVVGISPYRWEPQHTRRQNRIDEQDGIERPPEEVAADIAEHGLANTGRVYLDDQRLRFRILITNYEVELNEDVLKFTE